MGTRAENEAKPCEYPVVSRDVSEAAAADLASARSEMVWLICFLSLWECNFF